MAQTLSIGAWIAPLPGALRCWLNLAQRQETAVLDLRFAGPAPAAVAQALASAAPGSTLGVSVSGLADPRLQLLREWARSHAGQLLVVLPPDAQPEPDPAICWLAGLTAAETLPEGAFSGYVLMGHEAGGPVGEATSFVLLQQVRARTEMPLWVRGGVGPATAAACAAGGAQGVFLDDALLLFPELQAPRGLRQALQGLNGSETRLLAEGSDQPWRVFAPRRSPAASVADALHGVCERAEGDAAERVAQIEAALGWPENDLWPVGQGVGMAASLANRHQRIARLLAQTRRSVAQALREAATQRALAADAPLAQAQGTRYPLVQGPMTRVSDVPAFAAAVAAGGALPFLALALLRGPQIETMLAETTRLLGDRPWGVGLLGFIPAALRAEQLAAVHKYAPRYALIAGGRPDQAAEFEQQGVPAWLHVPSPALLRLYLEQGARRFIFEGRECGGHIGPLSSFALWEQMIDLLVHETAPAVAAEVEVLFAGGISDARSGAMIAALAAPLVARGVKIGGLMGTAYLFTQEIVATGAVVPEFAAQAVACTRTRNLVTGPGHATRCAATPFAEEFLRERQRLAREGLSAEALRDALEDLNLGRLRLASKGQDRDASGQLGEREVAVQRQDGLYMIGQVATLHAQATTIDALHQSVCVESLDLLAFSAGLDRTEAPAPAAPADVAVVGVNVILPQAADNDTFWRKLVHLESSITEVPRERWDLDLYFDPDKSARDKIYSRWGGFLDDVVFDPTQYGIAPNSMRSIDPLQLLALESTARALKDTGWGDDFDREHTSIILGAGGGVGELGLQYGVRAEIPRFVENPDEGVWDRLPEWTNESFAGVLLNVAAGRIANRLNFGGVNFVVDAACGSSLAAITLATQELTAGRANVAIAGGVDNVQGPYGFLCFAKTQALSPTGQPRTFDENADGIVISEGVATVVLKRLADAERDGDRIYAVIKGAAGSSDGRALGMTAPLPAGQKRALKRVYAQAGYGPETLGLVEAHGTGTAVGDRAEAETIASTLREHGAPRANTVVGSAKTLVGHTKCAAGAVGLIKATLALHHQVLPGHFGVRQPIDSFAADSPACLLDASRPWLPRANMPRRAAVSAFGFGGTNFHATLQEYPDPAAVPGGRDWPAELIVLSAADLAQLAQRAAELLAALGDRPGLRLAECAATLAGLVRPSEPVLAATVVDSWATLRTRLAALCAQLSNRAADTMASVAGWQLNLARPAVAPKVAFLYPGQGAQAVGRGREAALYLAPLRDALARADGVLTTQLPRPVSAVLWPAAAFDEATAQAQQADLTDTRYAQPALGALALGYSDWLATLGIRPDVVAGHSYGEFVALHVAGAMDADALLHLSAVRGQAMAAAAEQAPGAMAAILAARPSVETLIQDLADVHLANHNAPEQVVITGSEAGIAQALERAAAQGLQAQRLPVAGAFHSPLMAAAQAPLSAAIAATSWQSPTRPVYANRDGAPYPSAPQAVAAQLDAHLLGPVEFVQQLESMQAAGVNLYVEVGSRALLSGMLRRTLGPQAAVLAVDGGEGGLAALLQALAGMLVAGVPAQLDALWAGRAEARPDRAALLAALADPTPPRTAWLLAGGAARPLADPVYKTGKRPALTAADKAAARPRVPQQEATMSTGSAATPPLPSAPSPTPAAGGLDAQAFAAYQETMRAFLALQEKALLLALGGQSAPAPSPTPESSAALPSPPPSPQLASSPVQAAAPAPAAAASAGAVEPVEPSPAAVPAVDVEALVLAVTADKTGYPSDMLDLSADLEADLGIDSIKRVEIVGALQKELPQSVAQAMQGSLETYTRAKSLQSLVAAINALTPVATQTAPPVATAQPTAVTAEPVAALDAQALVLAVTADKTGYPSDMLDLSADLEADLGIDSIKRVEIVGALQKELPQSVAQAMQGSLETYTRAKSLRALIAAIEYLTAAPEPGPTESADAAPASTPAPAQVPRQAEPEVLADAKVPRQIIRPHIGAPAAADAPLSGRLLVIGADAGLESALRASAAAPELVFEPATADLTEVLAQPWNAIAYVPALFAESEAEARVLLTQWLALVQAIPAQTVGDDRRLLVATRLGGGFARTEDGVAHPITGGLLGGMLCLAQEQPQLMLRVVDFDGQDSAQMAQLLLAELQTRDGPVEVGYRGAQRWLVRTELAAPADGTRTPPPGQVILALGGARGITLACLQAWVERQAQTTLILVGRSEPATPADSPRTPTEWRQALIQRARAEGVTRTPREIDAEVAVRLAAQDVAAGIAALKTAGATVEYHALDARDGAALAALVGTVRERHGRIDGVLHAAGVIEDKLIAEKSADSFARVVSTKLDPFQALLPVLADAPPQWLAVFTSVAGRYGNAGQADYACANEALNRWAWVLSRAWPQTRVMACNWGPWDAGMASPAVQAQFRERGIAPISLAAGAAAFVAEVLAADDAVELVFGQGPWTPPPSGVDHVSPTRAVDGGRFVQRALELGAGGHLVQQRQLTLAALPFLDDHRLDGQPVLAAAAVAEWLAEAAAAGWPDWQVAEVADLDVLAGVALSDAAPRKLELRARASSHSSTDEQWVSLELRALEPARVVYRGRVRLVQTLNLSPPPAPAPLADSAVDVEQAYAEQLFHGPRFQLLTRITAMTPEGVDATLRPSAVADWLDGAQGDWLLDPGVLDCAPQLAILWMRAQHDATALPSRFGRIGRFTPTGLPPELQLRLRVRASSPTSLQYDAWILDAASGQVLRTIEEAQGTASQALNRLAGQAGRTAR